MEAPARAGTIEALNAEGVVLAAEAAQPI